MYCASVGMVVVGLRKTASSSFRDIGSRAAVSPVPWSCPELAMSRSALCPSSPGEHFVRFFVSSEGSSSSSSLTVHSAKRSPPLPPAAGPRARFLPWDCAGPAAGALAFSVSRLILLRGPDLANISTTDRVSQAHGTTFAGASSLQQSNVVHGPKVPPKIPTQCSLLRSSKTATGDTESGRDPGPHWEPA